MAKSKSPHAADDTDDRWSQIHGGFRWAVPERFNIAQACCGRWAARQPDAPAIHWQHEDGRGASLTYGELQRSANRLAHALHRLGVQRGDRVAIVMPQRFETAIANMAVFQLGAVAMPLSMLFGPDALEYRLQHGAARVAIVDDSAIANLRAVRAACPGLATVVAVGAAAGQGDADWRALLAAEPDRFDPVVTGADEAAVLIYTSGTTGPPKGALIPHRALIGNLTGFVCSQNWFPALLGTEPLRLARGKLGMQNEGAAQSTEVRPLSLGKGERGKGGDSRGHGPAAGGPAPPPRCWAPPTGPGPAG